MKFFYIILLRLSRFFNITDSRADFRQATQYRPRFLKKIWARYLCRSQILVEARQLPSNELALGFFIPILSEYLNATPKTFWIIRGGVFRTYIEKLRNRLSLAYYYGAANSAIFTSSVSNLYLTQAKTLIEQNLSPEEFQQIEVEEIRIGDLIYDTYLSRFQVVTIDFTDSRLLYLVAEFLEYVQKIEKYFRENKVSAVCVSHSVYLYALPARVALKFNALVFQINAQNIFRITNEYIHSHTDTKDYPNEFKTLPVEIRNLGLVIAEKNLIRRFNGEIGVDMHYSTASAYEMRSGYGRVVSENNNVKILIAVHDFYDSPHSYGDHFYPDFYLWLKALSRIAKESEYDWYIKTHPDVVGIGKEIIKTLAEENTKIKILNAEISHHELINQGIDFVLTVCGTIAMEYPALGKIAINASVNNPHAAYRFSITPENREEYEILLRNLKDLRLNSERTEIFEYYFMHNIYQLKSWIFPDYEEMLASLNGYRNSHSVKIFSYFISTKNKIAKERRDMAVLNFLKSGEIRLSRRHFEQNLDEFLIQLKKQNY
jgi:hypothetical protein